MAKTFHSNDISIKEILSKIEKLEIQLPDFQRGWVWDDNRIRALIASITNSYPVGAVMFLEYGGENIRFKYRPFTGVSGERLPEKLVLDGQQRLTSTFSSMFSRKPVDTKTDKNAEIKRYYYLDIEKCLDYNSDRVDAILSIPEDKMLKKNFNRDIVLDLSTREKEFENLMYPLNIVYDLTEASQWIIECCMHCMSRNSEKIEIIQKFQAEILSTIQNYSVPVITLDKEIPKEAVCQVFENVNTGGVSLTVFELITAAFAADDFELRKDWEKQESKLKVYSITSEVSATDFLTAITLFTGYKKFKNGGMAVSCKKKDVLNLLLQDYKVNADKITDSFISASKFLQTQRIFSKRDLPYSTQLIPLSVIIALIGDKFEESTIREKISRWYWCGVLGEMYGGANETRYALDVVGVMEWINGGDEPDTVSRSYFNPTRLITLQSRQSAAYKGIMALILKENCKDLISGKAMDFTVFLDEATDIHHIFPKAYCENKGYKRAKWNSIVNKTPLFARTNRILGGNAPSIYLNKIENSKVAPILLDEYLKSHLINVSFIRNDNFSEFFAERAKLILDIISKAMGKSINNRDSDDIIEAFGKPLV